jgi:hypothetical protein
MSVSEKDPNICRLTTCRGELTFDVRQVVPSSDTYVSLKNLIEAEELFLHSTEKLADFKAEDGSKKSHIRQIRHDLLNTQITAFQGQKVDAIKDKDRFLYYMRVNGSLFVTAFTFSSDMVLDAREFFRIISGDLKDEKVLAILGTSGDKQPAVAGQAAEQPAAIEEKVINS